MPELDSLLHLRGTTAWLTVATFVFPGLFVVAVEWLRGHEVEMKAFAWAAVFLPLATGVAGYWWVSALGEFDAATRLRTIHPGALFSGVLLVLALPAVSRARRRRKPLSPPAAG